MGHAWGAWTYGDDSPLPCLAIVALALTAVLAMRVSAGADPEPHHTDRHHTVRDADALSDDHDTAIRSRR